MVLAIDIGNSDVVLGFFESDNLVNTIRLKTVKKDSKSYYLEEFQKILDVNLRDVLLVSVVPDLTVIFRHLFLEIYKINIKVFSSCLDLKIKYNIEHKDKLGSDILLGVYAASVIYGLPAVVCDLGTATTICYLNEELVYEGGIITPGLFSSFNSLINSATLLKGFELSNNVEVLPKNTLDALSSGMFYFTIGGISYYLDIISKYSKIKPKVIITGGAASIYKTYFNDKYIYEPDLLLKGLYLVYKNNLFTED